MPPHALCAACRCRRMPSAQRTAVRNAAEVAELRRQLSVLQERLNSSDSRDASPPAARPAAGSVGDAAGAAALPLHMRAAREGAPSRGSGSSRSGVRRGGGGGGGGSGGGGDDSVRTGDDDGSAYYDDDVGAGGGGSGESEGEEGERGVAGVDFDVPPASGSGGGGGGGGGGGWAAGERPHTSAVGQRTTDQIFLDKVKENMKTLAPGRQPCVLVSTGSFNPPVGGGGAYRVGWRNDSKRRPLWCLLLMSWCGFAGAMCTDRRACSTCSTSGCSTLRGRF